MATSRPQGVVRTAPGQRLLMAAALLVATAAGIVGAVMLVAPSSTARSFAWPLGPRALAALVGGFYVVSAPVFAYAGRRSAVQVRGLAAAVLAFTLPTLAATYLHRDVFDFDRLFAQAWVVLFVASPLAFALLLWTGRQDQAPPDEARVPAAGRAILALLGVAYVGLAVSFWVRVSGPVPFALAPLGARFLAAWFAFFAVLAIWSSVRPARSEARLPLLALVAYGVGALLAAAVHPDDLGPGAGAYIAALLLGVLTPALVLGLGLRRPEQARAHRVG